MLILAMDANFRLKSKIWSVFSQDPTLGPGWSYFVNNKALHQLYVHQDEVSSFF